LCIAILGEFIMRKWFVAALLVLSLVGASATISYPAYALDTSGLTQEQINKLQAEALELKAATLKQNPASSTASVLPSVEEINKYADLGTNIGVGLANAAKQMGVAANDFAGTTIGKIAFFIIGYKLIGSSLVHLSFGLIWFIVGIPLWMHYFKKICLTKKVVEKFNEAGKRVSRETTGYDLSDSDAAGYRIVMFIFLAILVIVGLITIFSGI
jgi:hypothetical protein